jgi:threonine synthase
MALQIMPRLLSRALVKTGENRTALILVATSGDTGKAALEGYRDVNKTRIIVFYPQDGVSRVQKLQMSTQIGGNVDVCAVRGNFDDCQNGVKQIFSDASTAYELDRHGYFFSSANSINWGRLAPQIVYYVSAYCDLISSGSVSCGDTVNVCVPTGNFGNILAAYIAKLMGIPFGKLICASNSNNVLTDFIRTGTYDRNRRFYITMSPSMDILISSNLERLLWFIAGAEKTRVYMSELKASGRYTVSDDIIKKISETFVGYYADEKATASAIRAAYEKYNYLSDTHTAVALDCAEKYIRDSGDNKIIVTASTASPYKFAGDVFRSLTGRSPAGDLEAIDELNALTGVPVPFPLDGIGGRRVRFMNSVEVSEMKDYVIKSL